VIEFHNADEASDRFLTHEVEVEGHLIDSMILTRIWDKIMELGGDFEVLEFRVGKRKTDPSYIRMAVKAQNKSQLDTILHETYLLGAVSREVQEVNCERVVKAGVAPDGFYCTTNNPTFVYLNGHWVPVDNMMMDKVIVVNPERKQAVCKPIAELREGDLVVVGEAGVKVRPPERPRESVGVFEFMGSTVSSEKPAPSIIRQIAQDMMRIKKDGGSIVVVAGPAVVHTGAADFLAQLIVEGYADALLAGNALAVHDVEAALFGTSLGVSLSSGVASRLGHRNHMAAINEVFKAGSLVEAVRRGVLKRGIMYECIRRGVPYVLAGSIRDDGPLPDTIRDISVAQAKYRELLKGARMVIMLATMLHAIAVGNMLPSNVKIVCVDINPAVVTKLLDRGTTQAVGVVSDVGTFLPLLLEELHAQNAAVTEKPVLPTFF